MSVFYSNYEPFSSKKGKILRQKFKNHWKCGSFGGGSDDDVEKRRYWTCKKVKISGTMSWIESKWWTLLRETTRKMWICLMSKRVFITNFEQKIFHKSEKQSKMWIFFVWKGLKKVLDRLERIKIIPWDDEKNSDFWVSTTIFSNKIFLKKCEKLEKTENFRFSDEKCWKKGLDGLQRMRIHPWNHQKKNRFLEAQKVFKKKSQKNFVKEFLKEIVLEFIRGGQTPKSGKTVIDMNKRPYSGETSSKSRVLIFRWFL